MQLHERAFELDWFTLSIWATYRDTLGAHLCVHCCVGIIKGSNLSLTLTVTAISNV